MELMLLSASCEEPPTGTAIRTVTSAGTSKPSSTTSTSTSASSTSSTLTPTSSTASAHSICAWQLDTGNVVSSYKNHSMQTNCLSYSPSLSHFFIAHPTKALIHAFSSITDQIQTKSSVTEKLSSIAVSNDAVFLIAGTVTGNLYLWEVGSGRLLKTWTGHYKKINCIRFTSNDVLFITAADDAIIKIWSISSVLESSGTTGQGLDGSTMLSSNSNNNKKSSKDDDDDDDGGGGGNDWSSESTISSEASLTNHSLPVTDFHIGLAISSCRIYSCSLDRTARVWDMNSGAQLGVIADYGVGLRCITCDGLEQTAFVGSMDGRIFVSPISISFYPSSSSSSSSNQPRSTEPITLKAHRGAVNVIRVWYEGSRLISGSDDGLIHVWHLPSFSRVLTFNLHSPRRVTNILIVPFKKKKTLDKENTAALPPLKRMIEPSSSNVSIPTPFHTDLPLLSPSSIWSEQVHILKSRAPKHQHQHHRHHQHQYQQYHSPNELELLQKQLISSFDTFTYKGDQIDFELKSISSELEAKNREIATLNGINQTWQSLAYELFRMQASNLSSTTPSL